MCKIKDRIKQVNELLKQSEPANITVDRNNRTGYISQAIVDSMNAVFPYGTWGFQELSNERQDDVGNSVRFVAHVKVWLADGEGKFVLFQPTAYGEGSQPQGNIGDCKKAAQTDALKKALSYFSIGNRAYWGRLTKDKPNQQEPQF